MGNRAVITTYDALLSDGTLDGGALGIYLHWHGSETDIEQFLKKAKETRIRKPEDDDYGQARLVQLIANDISGGEVEENGIGINVLRKLDCDNGDNGVYIIKDQKIVGRMYADDEEE